MKHHMLTRLDTDMYPRTCLHVCLHVKHVCQFTTQSYTSTDTCQYEKVIWYDRIQRRSNWFGIREMNTRTTSGKVQNNKNKNIAIGSWYAHSDPDKGWD
jgi:hypothetical protein